MKLPKEFLLKPTYPHLNRLRLLSFFVPLFWGALPPFPAPSGAQCVPTNINVCGGFDDTGDIWINSSYIGNYPLSNSVVPCISIANPAFLNSAGTNIIAVRNGNTNPTGMWGSWSFDISCADGTHAYGNSSGPANTALDTPGNCALTPPAGIGANWFDLTFVPSGTWTVPATVTSPIFGLTARDLQTGVPLPPIYINSSGASSDTCESVWYRQYFVLQPITFTPTFTSTSTPTNSPTPTLTFTSTPTKTPTLTFTPTNSFTPTPTPTRTFTPTVTFTPTETFTPTNTATSTPTRTATNSPTITWTNTSTFTRTSTSTATNSPTPTATLTPCGYPGNTCTFTATPVNVDIFYMNKNIFNPATDQSVSIYVGYSHYPGEYSLRIYNSAGENIRDLVPAQRVIGPINNPYYWDGKNKNNELCASGVYIVYLVEPLAKKVKRLLLIR